MVLNIFRMCIVSLLVFATVLSSPVQADEPSSKAEFKQAYKSYQTLSEAGQWDEALPHAKNAYDLGQSLYADKPETLVALTDNYALNLMQLRQYDEAAPVLLEALSLYESIYGLESQELILPLMDVSRSLAKPKSGNQFNTHLKRAISISAKHNGETSAEHGQLLVDSASIYASAGQAKAVKNSLEQGHNILLSALGELDQNTGVAAYNLGVLNYNKSKNKKAIAYFDMALKALKGHDFYDRKCNLYLFRAYYAIGNETKATEYVLAMGGSINGPESLEYLPIVKVAPIYPANSASRGIQGSVTVEYSVDESGHVINPVVIENTTSATDLERASIVAARKFRYIPSYLDGKPVVTDGVTNRFTYELR